MFKIKLPIRNTLFQLPTTDIGYIHYIHECSNLVFLLDVQLYIF